MPSECHFGDIWGHRVDTGGTFWGHVGDTRRTPPTCLPNVHKMSPLGPPCTFSTLKNSFHAPVYGSPSFILQHLETRSGKVSTVLLCGRNSIFVVSGCPDGPGWGHDGTFLLVLIGLRVPLGQSECIVSARSSK